MKTPTGPLKGSRESVLVRGLPWVLFAMGMIAAGCSIELKRDLGNPLWYLVAAAICTRLPDLIWFKGAGFEAELARRVEDVEKSTDRAALAASQALATAMTTQGELIDLDRPRIEPATEGSETSALPWSAQPAIVLGTPKGRDSDSIDSSDEATRFYRRLKLLHPLQGSSFDSWKGVSAEVGEDLGGGDKREGGDRKLEVSVQADPDVPAFFLATMRVTSTNPDHSPLAHHVAFLLPTVFARQKVVVSPIDGAATLTKRVVRPFTVGLLTDTFSILEYDISKDPDLPEGFKNT